MNGNIICVYISVFFFFSNNVVWFTSVFQGIIGTLKILLFSWNQWKTRDIYSRVKIYMLLRQSLASLVAQMVTNPPAMQETRFNPWVGKIPWERGWQPTPVFQRGESHGERSLAGYSPGGCKESDLATEHAHTGLS